MSNKNIIYHDFYCLCCGNRITLPRKRGFLHGKDHRKKYFCIKCRRECNHYECYDDEDAFYFKEAFAAGVYKDEAEESIRYCAATQEE